MLASRILQQQETLLGAFLTSASAVVDDPPVGSPARADLDLIRQAGDESGLVGLRAWMHRSCALNVFAAHEHAQALRIVAMGDELLPIPAMSLARSVLEAVINTCWLLDAEACSEERLARWAGRLLHDSQETPAVLAVVPQEVVRDDERQDADEGRELGQRLMQRAGFTLKAKGGDRSTDTANVSFRGSKSNLTPKVDSVLGRFAPGEEHLWPMLSGATHSRGWLVAGLAGDEATVITSCITPVLAASDALVVEVGRYLDLPVRAVLERTHTHRVAILNRARPGRDFRARLDTYRASVGAWAVPNDAAELHATTPEPEPEPSRSSSG